MREMMLKRATLALLAFATVATAYAKEDVKGLSKIETLSVCNTLADQIKDAVKASRSGTNITDLSILSESAKVCREAADNAATVVRALGESYYVGGVAVFIGTDINTPIVAKGVSVGARLGYGASALWTYNAERKSLNLLPEFSPLVNIAGGGQYSVTRESARVVEPQIGVIIFAGNNNTKSINDFNGLYIGAGAETPNFFSSELRNVTTFSGSLFQNMNSGNFAITFIKSYNAGKGAQGVNAQILSVHNITKNGKGASIGDIGTIVGEQASDLYNTTADALSSLASSIKSKF